MAVGKAATARAVNRFDREADATSAGASRIKKHTGGDSEEVRPAKLHDLGHGKLSFSMVVRIKHWQARARRRPVPKGKVFVEKLVHMVTWNAPDYGPQTGPKTSVDPIQQRLAELSDADYANQVNETRKRVVQVRKDREFLETCYDILDSNKDGKLAPAELEHWVALLLADRATVTTSYQNCALQHWMGRNECGTLTDAERLDLQVRLEKKRCPRDRLTYDWQDFLLITLDFYILAGTLAMHQTFCRLLDDEESSRSIHPQATQPLPPVVALARQPIKLPRRRCDVIQAGTWKQRAKACDLRLSKHRQPKRPLPPVPAEVLSPLRPRQPIRPTRPVPAIAPGTPKRSLRTIQNTVLPCKHSQPQQSVTAVSVGASSSSSAAENQAYKDTHPGRPQVWSSYDVDSHGRQLGYVGPQMQALVDKRVELGMMPQALRELSVECARSARRVTKDMRAQRAGDWEADSDAGYGWENNLPVVIIPGLCSSGLEVKTSDVSPEWEGQRVWFSLEKLGKQRNATTRAAAKTVALTTEVATAPAKLVAQAIETAINLPRALNAVRGTDKTNQKDTGGNFIQFHLHRARDLIPGDVDGQSDPVARVELLNSEGQVVDKTESSIKENTRNPFWDESYELGVHVRLDEIHAVRISVLDDDGVLSKRDNLGEVTIELQRQLSSAAYRALPRAWHKLLDTRHRQKRSRLTEAIRDSLRSPTRNSSFGGEIECWADVVALDSNSMSSESSDSSIESDSESDAGTEPRPPFQTGKQLKVRATAGSTTVLNGFSSVVGDIVKREDFAGRTETDDTRNHSRATQVKATDIKDFDTKLWLRHMMLASDAHSDPSGIKVRAVPGLSGVDYLQPGAVMKATTWVFGPVIKFLKARGYDESKLKAAPYDWRMPPMYLEQRDGYFSKVCRTIEETYCDNGNKPVVLLAHSMGNNMAHYFSNWY